GVELAAGADGLAYQISEAGLHARRRPLESLAGAPTGGAPLRRLVRRGAAPGLEELVDVREPLLVLRPEIQNQRGVAPAAGKNRLAVPVLNVFLGPVDDPAGELRFALAFGLEQAQKVAEAVAVPLVGRTAHQEQPAVLS